MKQSVVTTEVRVVVILLNDVMTVFIISGHKNLKHNMTSCLSWIYANGLEMQMSRIRNLTTQ